MTAVKPVNPADYVPSQAVHVTLGMIAEARLHVSSPWDDEAQKRFNMGARWQLDVTLRTLVRLETGITGSQAIDELCAGLVKEATPEA